MAVRLVGLARAPSWLVAGFRHRFSMASRGRLSARYGLHQIISRPGRKWRFASPAGCFGLFASAERRRGGDNCTAAAGEVVLVVTGGLFARGPRVPVPHRETG